MLNYNFANTDNGKLRYAPAVIRVNGRTIIGGKAKHYAMAEGGPFYPIDNLHRPSVPNGKTLKFSGTYEVVDGKLVKKFEIVDIVPDELTVADYDDAMEKHIYDTRCERGYTTREPTAYLNSSVPRWASDARDWVKFVDDVMTYGLTVENRVADGGEIPTLDEFKSGLPTINWTYSE